MGKRVGIYARVSSKQQEDNTSLDGQIETCAAFAREKGYTIVENAERRDVVTGASRWGARTGFNELLAMGKRREIDAIIVDVQDRLGRGRALATLSDRAEKHGLEILFADGSELDSIALGVGIIKTGDEREKIGRRSRRGKLRSAKQGGVVFNQAPYGYKIVRTYDQRTGEKIGSSVEFDPDHIQTAVDIFEWFVLEGETIRGIQRRLYAAQILPKRCRERLIRDFGEILPWDDIPDIKDNRGRAVYNKVWGTSSIKELLNHKIYIGKWYYNKRITTRREEGTGMRQVILGERDPEDWVCIEVPAAITEALFLKAQDILKRNRKRFSGRPTKKPYLLRGLIFCVCGGKMYPKDDGNEYTYYRCQHNSATNIPDEMCRYPLLSQPNTDNLVWERIKEMLEHPNLLLDEYDKRREEQSETNAILLEQAEALRAEIAKGEVKTGRLIELYTDGDIDKDTYRKRKREYDGTIKEAERDLAAIQAKVEQEGIAADYRAELVSFCERMQGRLENPTFKQKRKILRILDVKVTHLPDQEQLKVTGTFPDLKLSITPSCSARPSAF